LTGTEEEKMIHLANKDLPTGTKYEIVADDYLPSDRTFRIAWEYVAGSDEKTSADLSAEDLAKYNMKENLIMPMQINIDKAKAATKDRLRA
jgi:hypothetical protein